MELSKRIHEEDSFTLIEIIVAISILSMFALTLGNLLGDLTVTSDRSRSDKQVAWLAQHVAEDLKANRRALQTEDNREALIDRWESGAWQDEDNFDFSGGNRDFEVEIDADEAIDSDDISGVEEFGFWRFDISIIEPDNEDEDEVLFTLRTMVSARLENWEEDMADDDIEIEL